MYTPAYLGTETPYAPFPYRISAPKGYTPVYLSHLGRHGSRYLTSQKDVHTAAAWLTDAAEKKQITYEGKRLLKNLQQLDAASHGNWGKLTPLGYQEEYQLAERMYGRFPQLFYKKIFAESTYVTRAVQSMDSFLDGLTSCDSTMEIERSIHKKVDPILRFFDLNLQYLTYKKRGPWKKQYESFAQRCNIPQVLLSKFVTKDNVLPASPALLANMIYTANCNSYNVFENSFMEHFFSCREMRYFWQNENCKDYLEKGPAGINVDLPQDIAFALLETIITDADLALESKAIGANLRFAHAETIIPFAALIGINHYGIQTNNLNTIPNFWCDNHVAPMAANIQFVFFGCAGKPTLVRVLYNERDAFLPLPTVYTYFYQWTQVKSYFQQILSCLPIPMEYPTITEKVKYFKV